MAAIITAIRSDRTLSGYAPKIAYTLSGGAAAGATHLGVIAALEERGIRPDLVVGTSAGALFGALYCRFGAVPAACDHVRSVLASDAYAAFSRRYLDEGRSGNADRPLIGRLVDAFGDVVRNGMRLGSVAVTRAMISERDAAGIFGTVFAGMEFDSLAIPFAAVATDLVKGAPAVFTGKDGGPAPLADAVRASASIPVVFPAVVIDSRPHVDGGVMANLPVREAGELSPGAFLAGFDVSAPAQEPAGELQGLDFVLRLFDLTIHAKQAADATLADVLLKPLDRPYPWSAFASFDRFVGLGKDYMTTERLAAFEAAYVKACGEGISRERNPFVRALARARLARIAGRQRGDK